jgi:hypothetical protein
MTSSHYGLFAYTKEPSSTVTHTQKHCHPSISPVLPSADSLSHLVLRIRIILGSRIRIEKPYQVPDPHHSQKPDPDPCQSQNFGAVQAKNVATEGHGRSKWIVRGSIGQLFKIRIIFMRSRIKIRNSKFGSKTCIKVKIRIRIHTKVKRRRIRIWTASVMRIRNTAYSAT